MHRRLALLLLHCAACSALQLPTRSGAARRSISGQPERLTRRAVVALPPLLFATALSAPAPALADGGLAQAYFSAGDPRFLQPVFDEVKYKGIKQVEVGKLGSIPAVKVTYNPEKASYKFVVGTFWRSCDPTSADQFGDAGPTIIWTATEDEKSDAEKSKRLLQRSTEYSSPTFGPMYKGRPILTEVRPLVADAAWEPAPAEDQDWYLNEAKAFEKLRKKSGRTKWFEDAFKPVTVTACEKQAGGGGSGTVCGYVYFPCSNENGCSAVTKGEFNSGPARAL